MRCVVGHQVNSDLFDDRSAKRFEVTGLCPVHYANFRVTDAQWLLGLEATEVARIGRILSAGDPADAEDK